MKPTLLVMAAGMGSRYGGVKQIDSVGVNGETLLDYGIYDAKASGFDRVVFIIRKDIEKDFRERLFDRISRNMDAEYVFQNHDSLMTKDESEKSKERTKPWGTVQAVLTAKDVIKSPFAVINSDDYYGRSAYKVMGEYLEGVDPRKGEHAMVGFVLRNTMSPSGAVTRGIYKKRCGYLTSIEETYKIFFRGDKVISSLENGEEELTGDELCSMNYFGFTPLVFDSLLKYWEEFKKNNITEMKKECLLPNAVEEIIKNKEGKVKVLSSSDKWFGMTYPEDRVTVKNSLKKKVDEGYYPEKLWEY